MPTVLAYRSDDINKEGQPPREALGYLAPSVGTFYLDGRDGHASFVWYHDGFIVDFHSHPMRFVGTASDGTVDFWVYEIIDEDVADTSMFFWHRLELTRTRATGSSTPSMTSFISGPGMQRHSLGMCNSPELFS